MKKSLNKLQKEKVALEIKDLEKKWFKRKDYLQILLPTTVTIFTLIYALVSGFFSSKYEKFQVQKEQLKLEVLYFEQKKENLIDDNNYLRTINDSLTKTLENEKASITSLENEIVENQKNVKKKEFELSILKTQEKFFDSEINRLKVENAKRKKKLEGELEKQYISESDLSRTIKEKNNKINILKSDIDRLKYEIKIIDDNPHVPEKNRNNFKIWHLTKMTEYGAKRIEESDKILKKLRSNEKKSLKKADSANAKYKVLKISN